MHKIGYSEEITQTRLIENKEKKQNSQQKLFHTIIGTNENELIKLSTKMIYLENKMLVCETKLEQF